MGKLFTLKEVAEELRVTRQTIRNWSNQGKIKTIRIGGRILVTEEEIERIKKGE